ncbi:MAG: hypothetical protein WCG25_08805 [bacterium]
MIHRHVTETAHIHIATRQTFVKVLSFHSCELVTPSRCLPNHHFSLLSGLLLLSLLLFLTSTSKDVTSDEKVFKATNFSSSFLASSRLVASHKAFNSANLLFISSFVLFIFSFAASLFLFFCSTEVSFFNSSKESLISFIC